MWSFLEPGYPYRQTVIVTLKSGRSFRGVLWQRAGGFLVLKRAEMVGRREGGALSIDGEILVPSGDVEFVQVVVPVKAE